MSNNGLVLPPRPAKGCSAIETGQVFNRLSRLDDIATDISSAIDAIFVRLEPIMVPVPEEQSECTEQLGYCDLAQRMDEVGDALIYQFHRLNTLLERIRL